MHFTAREHGVDKSAYIAGRCRKNIKVLSVFFGSESVCMSGSDGNRRLDSDGGSVLVQTGAWTQTSVWIQTEPSEAKRWNCSTHRQASVEMFV